METNLGKVVNKIDKILKSILLLLFVFTFMPLFLKANSVFINTSINDRPLIVANENASFSFLVGGHFYGAPGIRSVYPSSSVTMNIDRINKLNSSFLVLLGDNYRSIEKNNVTHFKKYFLDKINFPVFNAVGNHDLMPNQEKGYYLKDYETYKRHFGQTYYHFKIGDNQFIILDSELSNGNIDKQQLAFLKNIIKKESIKIKNVFFFSHRDIWHSKHNNFQNKVLPLLKNLKKEDKRIYFFSGDMSRAVSDLCLFEKDGIQFIHTHIADTQEDYLLRIQVKKNSQVAITPVALEHDKPRTLEACIYYTPPTASKITIKELIEAVWLKFEQKDFWYGVVFSILSFFCYKIAVLIIKRVIIMDKNGK